MDLSGEIFYFDGWALIRKLSDFGQMDLSKYKLTVAVSDDFVTICYNVTLKWLLGRAL